MNGESTESKDEKLTAEQIHKIATAPLPIFNIILSPYRYATTSRFGSSRKMKDDN